MINNRILSLTLSHIKSVAFGTISFPETDDIEKGNFDSCPSGIIGIYGQNGSGKTAAVDAFRLLKLLSLGRGMTPTSINGARTNSGFDYFLSLDSDVGYIEYSFLINAASDIYKMVYKITLKRSSSNLNYLSKESLTVFPFHSNGVAFKRPLAPLEVDYDENGPSPLYDGIKHDEDFSPRLIVKSMMETALTLGAKKIACKKDGLSLIFSLEMLSFLSSSPNPRISEMGDCVMALRKQISSNLYVYGGHDEAMSNLGLGTMLAAYRNEDTNIETHTSYQIPDFPFSINEKSRPLYEEFISEINLFVSSFVPSFHLHIVLLGKERKEDGTSYETIAIYRDFSGKGLPLSEESAGIKKLCNIACGLVCVYGNPSTWLVVDELDSGVFENLLGQILEAIKRNSKGQLLFTAHNLVPLEHLPSPSIVFTTSNPNNRYITFGKVAKTNNLRDCYLRSLRLGGQKEDLSSPVDVDDIDSALWAAYKSLAKWGKSEDGK